MVTTFITIKGNRSIRTGMNGLRGQSATAPSITCRPTGPSPPWKMAIPNSIKIISIIILFLLVGGGGFFLLLRFSSNSPNPPAISFAQAAEFTGQKKTVSGTIQSVFNNRKAVYIDFGDPHQAGVKLFRVRIPKENWPNFPKAPEEIYHAGDKISVTGKIIWYQGNPIISINSPLDITP